jgi:hypothetical protein
MRLLEYSNEGEFSLTEFFGGDIPRYAILSHTWGAGTEEVTFRDLTDGTCKDKTGYRKIRFCGEQARRDGLQFFWVDTCCIDKSNNTELTEAINSMFRWYLNAANCYIYLSDVPRNALDTDDASYQLAWKSAFRKSRWFTRGWTLQEVIAPKSVEFLSKDWEQLGNKISLGTIIHEITGIPNKALQGGMIFITMLRVWILVLPFRTDRPSRRSPRVAYPVLESNLPKNQRTLTQPQRTIHKQRSRNVRY